ncbi:hypothetical protein NFHSH190041_01950 [Shewanella sp. NFH-SH190041]|uniref:motility associated factor glycosyltransferase family protein n=1 Tax=Shewanella sp. NFH-SH190041 TaxID=2950245 RepID=UPI0021C2B01C|nr:6-hydroxymethylpterin diphosphokinase MptE-like protein [Shewanella sp. NFH-SH190041]BDM62743.1 hypothetical protein NFHSH190041_01950 [Shewanella sp. NFH-SH190041]
MSAESGQVFTLEVSQFGESYIPQINRKLFESAPSEQIFTASHDELVSAEDTLSLVIGTDSGLLLNYVSHVGVPAGSCILFVEHEDVIAQLSLQIPDGVEGIMLLTPQALEQELAKNRFDSYLLRNQVVITQSFSAKNAYFDAYSLISIDVLKLVDLVRFNLTTSLDIHSFVEQQLLNAADDVLPARQLAEHIDGHGRTAIVVAAGPSLDQHLDWLKQHQDSLYIFAVSRVARKLYDNGIIPDVLVSIDPYDISFTVSRDMLTLPDDILFVNGYHAVHTLVGQWAGPRCYLGDRYPWQREDNWSVQGPTVSNTALSLAGELGFERVLLLGVDLCNSQLGVTHAEGSREARLGPNINKIGEWVTTYTGELAETPIQLKVAMDSLATQVTLYPHSQFINLSCHAAQVAGITHIPLTELSLAVMSDKASLRATLAEVFSSAPNLSQQLEVKAELQRALSQLRQIEQKAKQALQLMDKFPATQGKIDRLEAELNRFENMFNLVRVIGFRSISCILSDRNMDELTPDQVKQLQQDYYLAMSHTVPSLQRMVQAGIDVVESRIWECNPKAVLGKLTQAWLSLNCPRRGAILLKRFAGFESTQPEFLQLQQATDVQMQDGVSNIATSFETWTHWPLDNVPDKIYQLRTTANQVGLEQVIYGLDNFQISDEAKRLSARAKSYLAELRQDVQGALQPLLDLPAALREETDQRQMVHAAIAAGRLDIAVELMCELGKVTDSYLPLLAKTLKIQGDYIGAVEVWLMYLNKYPQDVESWCALGDLLITADSPQDALQIFSQVLSLAPEHAHAQAMIAQLQGE